MAFPVKDQADFRGREAEDQVRQCNCHHRHPMSLNLVRRHFREDLEFMQWTQERFMGACSD
ncbi:hypothetical protein GCM10007216_00310 [Thalassobacillus devorans]|uniref:Uncharacterized protein n=1 Tax=Thalassobacillus devorans TaxID=279813 RepID=A0ABQ1NE86_9BACI|nr:hypothetical protein GCM10007216_00310 [Thalassobacillus devorans]